MKPIKLLNPRSSDTNVMGGEPVWRAQPTENRISALSKAFSWYNYFYGKKDARDMIVNYLESYDRKADVRVLKSIPDSAIRLTTGWLCRMKMVGLQLEDNEETKLDILLKEILSSKQTVEAESEPAQEGSSRPNIQDRLREKVGECAAELDGMFDEFMMAGAKMSADYKPIMVIRGMNVVPQMISEISNRWKRKLAEFEEAVEGKDALLVEAYSYLTKIQLRNCVKFCEAVINDCGAYVQIKKVERKPRTKKAVSPETQARKFKYLKAFEELKLESESPARLVGANEAWLYDSKKRKLIYVVADTHIGEITVKNNMILGFDATASVQKTLRKPADQIKALLAGGKPVARKYFKDIRATDTKFNGRGTENMIILRAGK